QIRCDLSEEKVFELAKIFDAPYIIHSNYINKTVRSTLHKLGKTTLLFEGGKSKNLDSRVIKYGVTGAYNVMKYLGMHKGEGIASNNPVIIKKSKWIRASHSGMLTLNIANGADVKKKDILGVIQDPFGEFERKIYAPFDCHVFCVNTSPIVNKGNAVFHVSIEEAE
nr:succinylglutamate desuccinylase/aspartoacylase family protein [FCB group bacterium]